MIFRARQFEWSFPRPAVVMGIINVTPDSFHDGGWHADPAAAVAHGLKLAADGAEILDVGGESTRPGASAVPEALELARVLPVIQALAAQTAVPISIDTTKAAVARAALAAGASIVNDVAAHRGHEALRRVVAEFGAGYVCMHAQSDPATMQDAPAYQDVIREVGEFFADSLVQLERAGISPDQVILDPGIGFAKNLEHNLQLIANLEAFVQLNRPVLLGVSRKSFIGHLFGGETNRRLPASLACASMAVAAGAHILRAHDVAETIQAVRLTEAILARKQ